METSEPEHTPNSHLQLVYALHAELLLKLLQLGGDAGAGAVVVVVVYGGAVVVVASIST